MYLRDRHICSFNLEKNKMKAKLHLPVPAVKMQEITELWQGKSLKLSLSLQTVTAAVSPILLWPGQKISLR